VDVAARFVTLFERRPVAWAVGLFAIDIAIVVVAGFVAMALGVRGLNAGFVALCVETVFVVAALSALRWWGEAGFNRPSEWRELGLLWTPANR
jgi:hypothetical protein